MKLDNKQLIQIKIMSKFVAQENIRIQLPIELHKQLKSHALELQKRQEEQMMEKLQREFEKQLRVKEIENNFVKWAERKTHDNQIKFDKVEKNKEDYLAKIVKKCKDRDKYLVKKHEDFKIVKKKNLNIAWKKAEQFNDDIQSYYKSKNLMSKTAKVASGGSLHENTTQNAQEMRGERNTDTGGVRSPNYLAIPSQTYNSSQIYGLLKNNQSTSYIVKDSSNTPHLRQTVNRIHSSSLQGNIPAKSSEAFYKHKELNHHLEKERIQQMGQKLQKIQKSKIIRDKRHQKKKSNEGQERSRNLTDNQKKYSPSKNKVKKDNRLYSQQSYKRESRVKDRTYDAKLKRQQMFEQHLAEGSQFLENLKVRHLKTVIAKNITYNAMEKKLYMERFHN